VPEMKAPARVAITGLRAFRRKFVTEHRQAVSPQHGREFGASGLSTPGFNKAAALVFTEKFEFRFSRIAACMNWPARILFPP